ncbi:MAG: pantoate--beta-alanine ligase [Oscillospiraceae bacterium]|nr:pantoate--beta-alanine ligase [Oscillospiraceae bacterium]
MSMARTIREFERWRLEQDAKHKTLGFVPTMGYLHRGHLSLIQAAKAENDLVAVSIFVNPTQFGPGEDYERYPRDLQHDYEAAVAAGADVVFHPSAEEIYPSGASTMVEVTGKMTTKLCGASRPNHFRGVTTVVSILFNIIRPDRAYFGQKDAQQAVIIRKMVRDLHLPVQVTVCPIIRDEDGLALSSRNIFLTPQERAQARSLNRGLQKAMEYASSGVDGSRKVSILTKIIRAEIACQPLSAIDYVEILDAETLDELTEIAPDRDALAAVAVRFGSTRLIDSRILSAAPKGEPLLCTSI